MFGLVLLAALRLGCYLPPVPGPVAEAFDEPACPYCAGHRGVEYDTSPATIVVAASAGTVTFAGSVAGTRYVSVLDEEGISATYGMLAATLVHAGQRVAVGQQIGSTGGRFYFGLRRDDVYLDPEQYLAVIRHRPRLVPSSGLPGRPASPRRPTCPALGSAR